MSIGSGWSGFWRPNKSLQLIRAARFVFTQTYFHTIRTHAKAHSSIPT
jgi:hypothetical protein